jgi:hypothetical protein
MGLDGVGRTHLYDRERCDLCCRHRPEWPVEDLAAGNGDRTRSHQTRTDGCGDPAGDQEESLPQCDHGPFVRLSGSPTPC